MKKKLILGVVMLMMMTMVGCSGDNQSVNKEGETGEKTVIDVWCWDPKFNVAIMEQAAGVYEAEHTNVDINVMDVADIEQKLHIALNSGSAESLPDILLNQDYSISKFLHEYPNAFADLTNEFDYSEFAQYKVDLMTKDEKIYGVPFDSGVAGLFYRTDYLEQAGFSDEDLQNITWDEYIEIGKVVKEKTGKYMLGINTTSYYKDMMSMMLQSAGSWFYDGNGVADFANNEVLREAINVIQQIDQSGIAINAPDWGSWVGKMNDGSVATVPQAVWISASIQAAEDQAGKWKVAPFPRLDIEGSGHYTNQGGSSWYVMEASENKEIAIDFLKSTYTGDEQFYQDILTNQGAIGSYLPAFDGKAYTEPHAFYSNQTIYQDFTGWMELIPGQDFGLYYTEARDMLHANLPALFDGSLSVDEFFAKSQEMYDTQVQ